MISIRPVTKENLDEILDLRVKADQESFVSPNAELYSVEIYDRSQISKQGIWPAGA